MLRLDDRWVWDLWTTRTQGDYHIFFLQAPRSLGDPELRHRNATIGHAISRDLRSWTTLPDALGPGPLGAWDDLATWTGSVIVHGGVWHMLYTGISSVEDGLVQRIGLATSTDLVLWTKHPADPVLVADPRWYEGLDRGAWREHAWRDPWVFRDPDGDGFHVLVTARAATGPADERGVVAHDHSTDLRSWTVGPPLSAPGEFAHLEVLQVEVVDGIPILVFSVGAADASHRRRHRGPVSSGTYVVASPSPLGPFDPSSARPIPVPSLYSGRLVEQPDGSWAVLGFLWDDGDGGFVGQITDPIPFDPLAFTGAPPG